MRTRAQRYDTVVYEMFPVFKPEDRKPLTVADIGVPCFVEGELDKYIVVSIPVTESKATAKLIREKAQAVLGRRVLVVSHNMQFLVTQKMTRKAGATIIKQMEEALHGVNRTDGEDQSLAEGVGEQSDVESSGSGSGVGVNGDSGDRASGEPETVCPAHEVAENGEGVKEEPK
jgi:hypothetical protein